MDKPRVMAIDWSGRSGPDQRRALWLAEAVDGELVRLEGGRLAAASEDAFDAAISAVVMGARVDELRTLPDAPGYLLEGKIWQPRDPVALGTGGRLAQGAYGELATAVAAVSREAAARGQSATTQAEQVLDMLNRRGLLGGSGDQSIG